MSVTNQLLWIKALKKSQDKNVSYHYEQRTPYIEYTMLFVTEQICKGGSRKEKYLFWGEVWEEKGQQNLFQGIGEWEDRRLGVGPLCNGRMLAKISYPWTVLLCYSLVLDQRWRKVKAGIKTENRPFLNPVYSDLIKTGKRGKLMCLNI